MYPLFLVYRSTNNNFINIEMKINKIKLEIKELQQTNATFRYTAISLDSPTRLSIASILR